MIRDGKSGGIVYLGFDVANKINNQLQTRFEFTPEERAALAKAEQHNVLIVVPAGNTGGLMSVLGQSSQEFGNILTVGAADGAARALYSSFGHGLDILADGGTVESPVISTVGEGYGTMFGTSVAAARVAGAAASAWAINPDLQAWQIADLFRTGAKDINAPGWDEETGHGLLDLDVVFELVRNTQPETYVPESVAAPNTWLNQSGGEPIERAAAVEFNGAYYEFDIPYAVQKDDTLSELTESTIGNGTRAYYEFVARQNGIVDPDKIYENQIIKLPRLVLGPAPTPVEPVAAPVPVENTGEGTQSEPGTPSGEVSEPVPVTLLPTIINGVIKPTVLEFRGKSYVLERYVVRPNDALSLIAERTMGNGSKPYYTFIAQQNDIFDPDVIYAGQEILVPREVSQSVVQLPSAVTAPFTEVFNQYQSTLGDPISGIFNHSSGAQYQLFEAGSIVTSNAGTFPLYGGIRQKYLQTGGLNGRLGAPTSAEIGLGNGHIQQNFEYGYIYWDGSRATAYIDGLPGLNIVGAIPPEVSSFEDALSFTLKWEGGYSNHPNDPGGATNKGITQRTYDGYRQNLGLASQDVINISDVEINDIYYQNYWLVSGSEKLLSRLAIANFDAAVNHGPGNAAWMLQEALSVGGNEIDQVQKYLDVRETFYYRLATNPSNQVFLQGWLNRLNDLRQTLLNQAASPGVPDPLTTPTNTSAPQVGSFILEEFDGLVGPSIGVNLRNSPRLNDRSSRNEPYNKRLEFDAWTTGETVTDLWLGTPDSRWFRVKDTEFWVPSGYIFGNPSEVSDNSNVTDLPNNVGPITTYEQYFQSLYGGSPGIVTQSPHSGHNAIDSVHQGPAPYRVYSLTDGVVRYVGKDQYGGNYVMIWNEELQRNFFYVHFSEFNPTLDVGATITAGEYLGNEGNTGNSTGRHTHFHITRPDGTQENPFISLSKLPSRNANVTGSDLEQTKIIVDSVVENQEIEIDYSRFDSALSYMHSEMIANADGAVASQIKDSLEQAAYHSRRKKETQPWNIVVQQWYNAQYTYHFGSALSIWGNIVRSGGEWDHKPKLDEKLSLDGAFNGGQDDYAFPIRGDEKYEYYYDIWSNIHYGYVGTAIGFNRDDLQFGADIGEALFSGVNDESDRVAVDIGVNLWREFGSSLTKDKLHKGILAEKQYLTRIEGRNFS